MSSYVIDQLRAVATTRHVPVIAYGLRTDFRSQLFEGSKRLFELADTIEEVGVNVPANKCRPFSSCEIPFLCIRPALYMPQAVCINSLTCAFNWAGEDYLYIL